MKKSPEMARCVAADNLKITTATQRAISGVFLNVCSFLVLLDNSDVFLGTLLIHQYNHDMPSLFFVQDDRSLC